MPTISAVLSLEEELELELLAVEVDVEVPPVPSGLVVDPEVTPELVVWGVVPLVVVTGLPSTRRTPIDVVG
jgi:hypothetical protein